MNAPATTRDQLLDCAQKLIREHGCNGFSYRDLAERVGVKTSSIHYYFPSKDDLLLEAIQAYSTRIQARLRAIDESLPADVKLDCFVAYLEHALDGGEKLCMGGMLAAGLASLSDRVAQAIQAFFRANEAWLAKVLAEGAEQGTLSFQGDPEAAGRALYAALQGSALACRLFKTTDRLYEVAGVFRTGAAHAAARAPLPA